MIVRAIFTFRHYDEVINSSLKRFGAENRMNHVRSWMNEDFSEFSLEPPPEETKQFIQSRWQPSLSLESGAALYWLFYNRLYFDLGLDSRPNVLLVKYEDLCTDPEHHFKKLFGFVGCELSEAHLTDVYSSSIRKHDPPALGSDITSTCERLMHRLN